jgi:hypothetical protein
MPLLLQPNPAIHITADTLENWEKSRYSAGITTFFSGLFPS